MRRAGMAAAWLTLLALAGWAAWRMTLPDQSARPAVAWEVPNEADVARLEIRPHQGAPVALRRSGKDWQVKSGAGWVPARGDLADRLVRDLAGMRVARVVARDRSHDAELGLAGGVRVTLQDASGQTLLACTVGKQGSDLLSTYVRVQGHPEVLAVDKALVWQVRRPLSGWVAEQALKASGMASRANTTAEAGPKAKAR